MFTLFFVFTFEFAVRFPGVSICAFLREVLWKNKMVRECCSRGQSYWPSMIRKYYHISSASSYYFGGNLMRKDSASITLYLLLLGVEIRRFAPLRETASLSLYFLFFLFLNGARCPLTFGECGCGCCYCRKDYIAISSFFIVVVLKKINRLFCFYGCSGLNV